MEIILKKEMPSLGKIGSTVKVAEGYARNYLIPRGVGIEATPKNLKLLEREIKIWEKKAQQSKDEAIKLAAEIEKLNLSFARKTGEEDKLFGSVTTIDIAESIKEAGFHIDRKQIHLEEPLKTLGDFTVPVKLHPDVAANLKVTVVKE
ncbi:MAG: 50S ribosomal protein L9 [Deltaproteobacteria bacterium GWC2_42_51]|nr:MAG: 50S ribosomal protein L9 [Deltaproteobacteria bacterium GWC2_42_51]OGP44143.1 MAG: 50S ribosomal protein L9 [Deltaproteobacteria bacterium GWD2_42_10]OGP47189.1 MAG: 50S ribosomal protein L9 [Deltaproteobacteria bacterium GWF2_42_12]OGQ68934.1 MAG: 50S ribosomal protein L9 [Deltaproteobacteria bacterium RIFCSPLOWO2_12_FULL_42_16]OGQ76437.1 MAG: 50S ribosomal protein L9 [Deltaproteobacteria bacterium RIFOXYA2_FULL_42_10]